jgi:type II secretory pathway pseudopilin PulG
MREEWGATLIELVAVLVVLVVIVGGVVPVIGRELDAMRAHGAAAAMYGAVHLTKSRARASGVMHALVVDPGGRSFRIVEDPAGAARTVVGPLTLVEGAVATPNITIRFSPKGFAVPFGTITVTAGPEVRRVIVNIVGRVRYG